MASSEILPSEAVKELNSAMIIDVRSPAEFETVHVSSAINIPLESLNEDSLKVVAGSKKLMFICQSGTRGGKAAALASKFGLASSNIKGGTSAWESAGLPVHRGMKSVSLERQVRICAGALVALGTLGAIFYSTVFLTVPLFVGCGLVFAGLTDSCAMGMLLAKMPWNNKGPKSVQSCQVPEGKL
jgi:rhodanese-related sulfurtransferase